jgi:outer membrane protein W
MKFGINFLAGDIKLAIDPNCHLRGMMGLSLNVFTNPKEVLTLGLLSVVRTHINIVSFQLGAEYAFSPKNRISPFVGGAFTSNFISGDDFSAQTRYGLRFTVGGDIKIRNNFGAIMGISYDIANLMGKSTNINTLRYDVNQFPLNDEEFTLEGNKISAKTISYLNFYVGFSLFLGNN